MPSFSDPGAGRTCWRLPVLGCLFWPVDARASANPRTHPAAPGTASPGQAAVKEPPGHAAARTGPGPSVGPGRPSVGWPARRLAAAGLPMRPTVCAVGLSCDRPAAGVVLGLPAACCLLPAACCLLPAACCLLPAACCLPSADVWAAGLVVWPAAGALARLLPFAVLVGEGSVGVRGVGGVARGGVRCGFRRSGGLVVFPWSSLYAAVVPVSCLLVFRPVCGGAGVSGRWCAGLCVCRGVWLSARRVGGWCAGRCWCGGSGDADGVGGAVAVFVGCEGECHVFCGGSVAAVVLVGVFGWGAAGVGLVCVDPGEQVFGEEEL